MRYIPRKDNKAQLKTRINNDAWCKAHIYTVMTSMLIQNRWISLGDRKLEFYTIF